MPFPNSLDNLYIAACALIGCGLQWGKKKEGKKKVVLSFCHLKGAQIGVDKLEAVQNPQPSGCRLACGNCAATPCFNLSEVHFDSAQTHP